MEELIMNLKMITGPNDINDNISGFFIEYKKLICTDFFIKNIGIIPVNEIMDKAIDTPLNPTSIISDGTKIHVSTVQNTISLSVSFIFPRAFNAFTKGLEKAENTLAKANK